MEPFYESCTQCPKKCGTARNAGIPGFCGEPAEIRLAWAGLHFGEEPPVTGSGGSGTLFVTGCNLGCSFCQNYQISNDGMGTAVSPEEFAEICLALASSGAENINIVTGSHAIPGIAAGLEEATLQGLSIPVLWNSSAYETPEALSLLDGLVQVWLPDLKTLNPLLARSVFRAEDYPAVAKKAVRWMANHSPLSIEQTGSTSYPNGKIVSGVIIRHLALPGKLADTELVLRWFAEHLQGKALLSLMTQYTPVSKSAHAAALDAFPDRVLDRTEYNTLVSLLDELGIDDGFYQELVQDTEWLPDFERIQPFTSVLAKPVWHWKQGFIR